MVVITTLPFFKLPQHSDSDVVHFMVRRSGVTTPCTARRSGVTTPCTVRRSGGHDPLYCEEVWGHNPLYCVVGTILVVVWLVRLGEELL